MSEETFAALVSLGTAICSGFFGLVAGLLGVVAALLGFSTVRAQRLKGVVQREGQRVRLDIRDPKTEEVKREEEPRWLDVRDPETGEVKRVDASQLPPDLQRELIGVGETQILRGEREELREKVESLPRAPKCGRLPPRMERPSLSGRKEPGFEMFVERLGISSRLGWFLLVGGVLLFSVVLVFRFVI